VQERHADQGTGADGAPPSERHVFRDGGLALLVDRKERRYLVRLKSGATFHTHLGALRHDSVIGLPPGARVVGGGHRYLALAPTLADYIQESTRMTQIIYPKDLGAILLDADIFPGARVLEAGLGSGALTLALLRAVGPTGRVFSYEIQEDRIAGALANIREVVPDPATLEVRCADVCQGIEERDLDRVVLDVPEPWRALEHVAGAMAPGGILLCYLPTILQVHELAEGLEEHPRFDMVESFEVLRRRWHVTRQSVRPDHRMVGHTGFMTTARLCEPTPGVGA